MHSDAGEDARVSSVVLPIPSTCMYYFDTVKLNLVLGDSLDSMSTFH